MGYPKKHRGRRKMGTKKRRARKRNKRKQNKILLMELDQVIKKIRNYSIVILLLPLIAINSCLILYKTLGNIQLFPDFQWNKENIGARKLLKVPS